MKTLNYKITAVVLAGGQGLRMKRQSTPKHLIKINGKHIVSYCLDIYQNLNEVDSIILVANHDHLDILEMIVEDGHYNKVENIVSGGESRQESVYNGISSVTSSDLVVIQNGVSIFTSHSLIRKCIELAKLRKAVSAFCPETYSSFTFSAGKIDEPLDRSITGHVRDPQVYDFNLISALHKKALNMKKYFTNDILLSKAMGQNVFLVESSPENFKITSDMDINLAKMLLDNVSC